MPALAEEVVAAEEGNVLEDDVGRDQRHLTGDHHRPQRQQEERVAAGELALGEGIGGQRREQELEER